MEDGAFDDTNVDGANLLVYEIESPGESIESAVVTVQRLTNTTYTDDDVQLVVGHINPGTSDFVVEQTKTILPGTSTADPLDLSWSESGTAGTVNLSLHGIDYTQNTPKYVGI